ncbi:MAG: TPM domain-containing protein [Leptospiraceae bacterium]|nr:TPM domain-containing protein [Leptospiraceae bacterium]
MNDTAQVLSEAARERLEARLQALDKNQKAQFVIVTVPDMGGSDIETFSIALAESWGIGHQGKDDGILILLALQERRVRIEVGYGLEPILTDARSKQIIDQAVLPAMKRGDPDQAMENAAAAIEQLLDSAARNPAELDAIDFGVNSDDTANQADDELWGGRLLLYGFWAVVFLILALVILSEKGLLFWSGLVTLSGMLAAAAALEYAFQDSGYGSLYWLSLLFAPGIPLLPYLWLNGKLEANRRERKYLAEFIKSDAQWRPLFKYYQKAAVKAERERLLTAARQLTDRQTAIAKISALNKEIKARIKHPEQFFSPRSDLELIKGIEKLNASGVLKNGLYRKESRREAAEWINGEADYFKAQGANVLDTEQRRRLAETVEQIAELLKEPLKRLQIDTEWVLRRIRSFIESSPRWKGWESAYTLKSIRATRQEFRDRLKAAETGGASSERAEKLYSFYVNYIQKIEKQPASFLVAKPRSRPVSSSPSSWTTASSGSSSSSSSSWSFGSSSSASFSSTDSFGGGSFGGGGSSGSW